VNPFYFGPSSRPLFGIYTQGKPSGATVRRAVLLCYPIAGEYMRAHRAFRQLNTLLNRAGLDVLRFDYSCTGDSAGDGEEASFDAWLEDIAWAADELKENAGLERISVAGLRFGATLAALFAARRSDVERLVLWDPVVRGKDYLDETIGTARPNETVGAEGHPMTPALVARIDSVDLAACGPLPVPEVSILVAEDAPAYRALYDRLAGGSGLVELEVVPSPGSWTQADPFGSAYIPEKIIQAVVSHLQREDRR
jgi:pimeloyl-ACP methyl ester carboxylesterase